MRFFPIFMLLRCSLQSQLPLAARDTRASCDRSFIKGVDPSKLHFDVATKTLTCVAGENSLMAIQINSTSYDSLTCHTHDGWKAQNHRSNEKIEEKVADASTELNIACVEHCAAHGDGVIIENKNNNDQITVSCHEYLYVGKNYSEQLYYDNIRIYGAFCSHSWTLELDKKREIKMSSEKKLQFECRLEQEPAIVSEEKISPTTPITTTLPSKKPKDDPEAPEKSVTKCQLKLISRIDSPETDYNLATKTLTCKAGKQSLMAIEFKSKRYVSLSCDETEGWIAKEILPSMSPRNREKRSIVGATTTVFTKVAETLDTLDVACVEYCATNGTGVKVTKHSSNNNYDTIDVSCEGNYSYEEESRPYQLFYGQKQLAAASCRIEGPWEWQFIIDDSTEPIHRTHSETPTIFECKIVLPTPNLPELPTTSTSRRTTATTQNTKESTVTTPITSTTTSPSTTVTSRSEDKASDAAAQSNMKTPVIVIGSSIGGFIVGAIVVVVIFTMLINRKRRPASNGNGTSMNVTEEGRKKMKKRGGSQSMISSDSAIVSSGQ